MIREDKVRLSIKELTTLPARVFASARMPWGASGGAVQMVEFLELAGMQGLARLDAVKEDLELVRGFEPPRIVEDSGDTLMCDIGQTQSLYLGAALSDLLASRAKGRIVGLAGGRHADFLAAVPYLVRSHGLSSMILTWAGVGDRRTATVSACLVGPTGWAWRHVADLPVPAGPTPSAPALETLSAAVAGFVMTGTLPDVLAIPPDGISTLAWSCEPSAALARYDGTLDQDSHAIARTRASAEGWPVEHALFERLMTFADKSLIRTSEQSRRGAG